MTPILHPFQADLYARVRDACARHRIVVVQAATGAGKTVWASYLTRQAYDKGNSVLFIVHRRRLVDQISERLRAFEVPHGVIMRGDHYDRNHTIQVASRDTLLSRCVRNEWIGMPEAKVVIVDEAHHSHDQNSEYRRILERYPTAIILLLSATPVGPDGSGMGPWAEAIECAAPTSQLVHDGFLCRVDCYVPDRKRRGKKYVRGIAGDLVESWKQYGENRPTVLFCTRVQHSLDAVEAYKAAGITAVHMDADTPDDERDQAFADVAAGRIKIVSNVGIVGEGVDVPELGCCQLYCEVNSRVKFLQAAGRIMRPAEGKTYGILIDHSGAVYRHGFPDEDTEWTLTGNVNEAFAKKHDNGQTAQALYCRICEMVYHGGDTCPRCGRAPQKPPKSIFAPPPMKPRNEILIEAERANGDSHVYAKDEKIKHWLRCLAVASNKESTFGMASQIYRRKYNAWPGDDFPCMPQRGQWKAKVKDIYPNFGKRRA